MHIHVLKAKDILQYLQYLAGHRSSSLEFIEKMSGSDSRDQKVSWQVRGAEKRQKGQTLPRSEHRFSRLPTGFKKHLGRIPPGAFQLRNQY